MLFSPFSLLQNLRLLHILPCPVSYTHLADTIEDVSDLTDIENVKGDEKFTQNADGTPVSYTHLLAARPGMTVSRSMMQSASFVLSSRRMLFNFVSLCVTQMCIRDRFKVGDIIVAQDTCNEMMEKIRLSSGLILEKNSINCHGAIAGLSLDIPVLIGAENATQILKSGAFVTLDGKKGIVSCNN